MDASRLVVLHNHARLNKALTELVQAPFAWEKAFRVLLELVQYDNDLSPSYQVRDATLYIIGLHQTGAVRDWPKLLGGLKSLVVQEMSTLTGSTDEQLLEAGFPKAKRLRKLVQQTWEPLVVLRASIPPTYDEYIMIRLARPSWLQILQRLPRPCNYTRLAVKHTTFVDVELA